MAIFINRSHIVYKNGNDSKAMTHLKEEHARPAAAD